jgi:Aspartyl protease
VHLAILPEVDFAGAKIRNVVVMVFDDANLNIPLGEGKSYQIQAILGFPVFQALKAITFSKDGYFEARAARKHAGYSRIFLDKLTPLVEGEVDGKTLLFSFDTGAGDSEFTKKYFDAFPKQFEGLKTKSMGTGGAGGMTENVVYELPSAKIEIGGQHVELSKVMTLTTLAGTGLDELYGNLGQDLIGQFGSFTLDFGRMRFSLEK